MGTYSKRYSQKVVYQLLFNFPNTIQSIFKTNSALKRSIFTLFLIGSETISISSRFWRHMAFIGEIGTAFSNFLREIY